ncbi:DUF4097 family beta strand repeat-containing protein [Paenibacillus sp. FJAT-26967]|uniref:DUF4097 family beta strand repeat-containing protein n=1 Tax=Paenibacillus sp. FJAT-26967 TaxID=1729690 RepID=UPI0008384CE7|nr:DUF4097 family beta strand repeat-containing protein [Paenibacillus sp. FJAT-26967]
MSVRKLFILAGSLIGIAIIGNVILFFMGQSPFNLVELNQRQSVSTDGLREVKVESHIGEIEVIPADGNEIQVQMNGKATRKWEKDYELTAVKNNGVLTVEFKEKGGLRVFDLYSKIKLSVAIPAKTGVELLEVKTDTDPIRVHNIRSAQFAFSSDTGSIDADVPSGKFDVKSDTGNVTLRLKEIAGPITVVTDTGHITVQTSTAPASLSTNLQTDSGVKRVTLPEAAGSAGPLVELRSDSGNVSLLNE